MCATNMLRICLTNWSDCIGKVVYTSQLMRCQGQHGKADHVPDKRNITQRHLNTNLLLIYIHYADMYIIV